jgi:hypothetical protein
MISRLIAVFAIASAAQPPTPVVRAPSPSYTITASIAPAAKRLDGRARIHWRNATTRTADEIQLHLFYNGQPTGSIALTRLRDLPGDRDLLGAAQPLAAGGPRGASILRVPLPRAIEPGGEIAIDAQWSAALPDDATRGDVVLAAHWFPQLAVFTDGGWTAHQDAARSYVFADAAAYDVTIDAPDGWDVAAAGREAAPATGGRGRRFVQRDAGDFAFAVGRSWIARRSRVERSGGDPIELRLRLRPEHAAQADRIEADIRAAFGRDFSTINPYPYADLTIVDLPWQWSGERGVFPGLATLTTRWIAPSRVTELETALARAVAAQSWQSAVPADAVANRWLVDGLSAYAAVRLSEPLVQRQLESTDSDGFLTSRFFGGFVPYAIRAFRVNDTLGHDGSAAVRPARALQTLERYLGSPTFETILSEYARRFRFEHPASDDFAHVVESVSGRDLRWFFDEALGSSRRFDYAVGRVETGTVGPPVRYRTTVTVARVGDGVFSGSSRPPIAGFQSGRAVEIAAAFGDGTTLRDVWDGRARSMTFAYDSVAPIASVTIDPDRVLALDVRRTNNSWAAQPKRTPTSLRWSARWMTWLQSVLLTYGLLV